jgi:hypothetical protein
VKPPSRIDAKDLPVCRDGPCTGGSLPRPQTSKLEGTRVYVIGPRTIVNLEAFAILQLEIQRKCLSANSDLLKCKWCSLFGRMGIGQCPAKAIAKWRTRLAFQNSNNPASIKTPAGPNYIFPGLIEVNTRGTLLHSLNAFRFLDATDPRDRVYAFLSIVRDSTPDLIPVSYGEPLASCFSDVACFVIEKYRVLEFLCHVRLPLKGKDDPEGLPSGPFLDPGLALPRKPSRDLFKGKPRLR